VIIDAFLFNNEVDLLHMRLEELYPVVDQFLLVQAFHTFRGTYKGTTFDRHDPQWAPYIDKIVEVSVGLTGGADAWERERYQRNMISTYAKAAFAADDIIMISDVDEIPRRAIAKWLPEALQFEQYVNGVQFEMDMYYYALNVYKGKWTSLKALRVAHVDSAEQVRHREYPTILGAGWHYSYLGDDEFIGNKLRSFSHSELDTPLVHSKIAENRAALRDPYNHQEQLVVMPVSLALYPHAVMNNLGKWLKYIWH
jgi:beta-1,4-mannosyl-glycoprotein beta-1,4-N-acetylglucosaminyltransferase